MEEKIRLPDNFERSVSLKLLTDAIVYRKEVLEEFFKRVSPNKGPFSRGMFVPHSDLIKRVEAIGIKLYKSSRNGKYYIDEEVVVEPVLFNTELLDIPNEEI